MYVAGDGARAAHRHGCAAPRCARARRLRRGRGVGRIASERTARWKRDPVHGRTLRSTFASCGLSGIARSWPPLPRTVMVRRVRSTWPLAQRGALGCTDPGAVQQWQAGAIAKADDACRASAATSRRLTCSGRERDRKLTGHRLDRWKADQRVDGGLKVSHRDDRTVEATQDDDARLTADRRCHELAQMLQVLEYVARRDGREVD